MKATLLSFFLFVSFSLASKAQNPLTTASSAAGGAIDLSTVLTTLGEGIKPGSFTPTFKKEKDAWLAKAKNVKPTDVTQASMLLTQLGGGLKSTAFTGNSYSSILDWATKTKSNKSMADLGGSISSLVGNLNTSTFTKSFADNKDQWMNALNSLTKM